MTWLAIDIGGANLKTADGQGYASSQYFPLWEESHRLDEALRAVIAEAPPADHLVATMTGELADCYETKAEGVSQILRALSSAADGRHTRIYRTDGQLVSPQVALREPLKVSASNWHALATFACRFVPRGTGMLIDIGSTTSDLVPLTRVRPTAQGLTDPERMLYGELVYTGVERSPVCGLVSSLPWRGEQCPTANEVFATTADVYVTLGQLAEDPSITQTADKRPLTKPRARDRLARCICADREMFDASDAVAAAESIHRAQLARLGIAAGEVIARMRAPPQTMIVSGRGEFLARQLIERLRLQVSVVSLSEQLGAKPSRSATAHALAVLAMEASQL